MYVYNHIYIYIYVHMYMYIYIHTHMYRYMYTFTCIYIQYKTHDVFGICQTPIRFGPGQREGSHQQPAAAAATE